MAFTYIYKRRIGSWGLLARVTVDVQPVDEPPREGRRIDDSHIWWLPPQGIPAAEEKWMAFGLGLVAGQLETLRDGADALWVRVDDWDVPMLTDYQEEVAAAAVIECLRENCGIDGVDISLTFDREGNRHQFTWDGASAEQGHACPHSSTSGCTPGGRLTD
ncbi:hypothetical protein [Streptomyces sp. NPDC007206]|uniref:hypothetical protein n=1 Tax=Streptomyces sp. NPDC007206 TaxID=3154317 RepID=UPI0033E211AB